MTIVPELILEQVINGLLVGSFYIMLSLGLSLIFITHDLRVAANVCDLVAVMQNGKVVESGETARVFANPAHPYTQALLDSIPGRDWNAAPH